MVSAMRKMRKSISRIVPLHGMRRISIMRLANPRKIALLSSTVSGLPGRDRESWSPWPRMMSIQMLRPRAIPVIRTAAIANQMKMDNLSDATIFPSITASVRPAMRTMIFEMALEFMLDSELWGAGLSPTR